jgi:hypothetical protein
MAEPQNISRKYQNRMINAQYPKHQLNKHKKNKKRRMNVRQPNQLTNPKPCLTQASKPRTILAIKPFNTLTI